MKKNPKVNVSVLSMDQQRKWAQSVPNIAAEWVKRTEARGLPAGEVLKVYMDGMRARGEKPLRNWDK